VEQLSEIFFRARKLSATTFLARGLVVLNFYVFIILIEGNLGLPKIIKYLFSLYALISIFWYSLNARSRRKVSAFSELIILLFVFYSLYLVLSSIRFDLYYIQEFFAGQFFLIPYLVPILFLYKFIDLDFYRLILKYTKKLLPLCIIVEIIVILTALRTESYPENVVGVLLFTVAPMLLYGLSNQKKERFTIILLITYFALFAFICAALGRRGETIEVLYMLSWGFFIKYKSRQTSRLIKQRMFMFSAVALVLIGLAIPVIVNELFIFERGFDQDGFEESRGETVTMFFSDFGTRGDDYLFGRGLNGLVQKFDDGVEGKARFFEIGYLTLLMKGGVPFVVLYVLLMILAFYNGFFKSKNDLVKLLAGYPLWQLIYMVSFGVPNFNFYYTFLWIAVATCLNRSYLNLSNQGVIDVVKGA